MKVMATRGRRRARTAVVVVMEAAVGVRLGGRGARSESSSRLVFDDVVPSQKLSRLML